MGHIEKRFKRVVEQAREQKFSKTWAIKPAHEIADPEDSKIVAAIQMGDVSLIQEYFQNYEPKGALYEQCASLPKHLLAGWLREAVKNENPEMVSLFIKKNRENGISLAETEIERTFGYYRAESALHLACGLEDPTILQSMLPHVTPQEINVYSEKGGPLFYANAIRFTHIESEMERESLLSERKKLLMAHGANPNLKGLRNELTQEYEEFIINLARSNDLESLKKHTLTQPQVVSILTLILNDQKKNPFFDVLVTSQHFDQIQRLPQISGYSMHDHNGQMNKLQAAFVSLLMLHLHDQKQDPNLLLVLNHYLDQTKDVPKCSWGDLQKHVNKAIKTLEARRNAPSIHYDERVLDHLISQLEDPVEAGDFIFWFAWMSARDTLVQQLKKLTQNYSKGYLNKNIGSCIIISAACHDIPLLNQLLELSKIGTFNLDASNMDKFFSILKRQCLTDPDLINPKSEAVIQALLSAIKVTMLNRTKFINKLTCLQSFLTKEFGNEAKVLAPLKECKQKEYVKGIGSVAVPVMAIACLYAYDPYKGKWPTPTKYDSDAYKKAWEYGYKKSWESEEGKRSTRGFSTLQFRPTPPKPVLAKVASDFFTLLRKK